MFSSPVVFFNYMYVPLSILGEYIIQSLTVLQLYLPKVANVGEVHDATNNKFEMITRVDNRTRKIHKSEIQAMVKAIQRNLANPNL